MCGWNEMFSFVKTYYICSFADWMCGVKVGHRQCCCQDLFLGLKTKTETFVDIQHQTRKI